MRIGWWWPLILVALSLLVVLALRAHSTQPAAPPETAVRPGYVATYNYTVSVYLGQERILTSYNEFRVRVKSVEGDVIYFYYQPLVSFNESAGARGWTLNYTYALVPSNLTTYYWGFGMPLFLSNEADQGSGGANATVNGYEVSYRYMVLRSGGDVMVSLTAMTYNGSNLVSAQYWYYLYNGTTGVLESSTGLLLTPSFAYRFDYELVGFEVG